MRKILLAIIVTIVTVTTVTGQEVGYVSFSPGDNGIGLRADCGHVYGSMQWGNYWLPYGRYIKDHSEIALGVIYRDFTLGMAYHHYGDISETLPLNKATFYPISVELGARVFVGKWFVAAIRYDVIRCEGTVDFGFCF
jgi:hypothetical protein